MSGYKNRTVRYVTAHCMPAEVQEIQVDAFTCGAIQPSNGYTSSQSGNPVSCPSGWPHPCLLAWAKRQKIAFWDPVLVKLTVDGRRSSCRGTSL